MSEKEKGTPSITKIVNDIFKLEEPFDLKQVYDAYRARFREINMKNALVAKRTLSVGQKVQYKGKHGLTVGVIESIASTRATVKVGDTIWLVPLGMLEPAS